MSRIGRAPITLPEGVEVRITPGSVTATGPLGELEARFPAVVDVVRDEGVLHVVRHSDQRREKAFHGLARALVANVVRGVSEGFQKTLELHGVGYRAQLQEDTLHLQLGYSHPIQVPAPDGVTFEVPSQTRIIVKGASKELVGQVASDIRRLRPVEPYKGKGIRYEGEPVRRKVGKAGK